MRLLVDEADLRPVSVVHAVELGDGVLNVLEASTEVVGVEQPRAEPHERHGDRRRRKLLAAGEEGVPDCLLLKAVAKAPYRPMVPPVGLADRGERDGERHAARFRTRPFTPWSTLEWSCPDRS